MAESGASESTRLAHERTDLAMERTLLAQDRTLMAWVRTATSLISFGFTIYKFFDYLTEQSRVTFADRLFGPRTFATSMIVCGLAALVLASISYHHQRAALERAGAPARRPLALILAIFVAGLGILGLFLVVLRQ